MSRMLVLKRNNHYAKATNYINKHMSTNVSKEKREKLVEKIKAIKTYIATAEQDENTARLLTYIAEIEKDIKGKKYGLVFEEHRESIDETLANNLPVLVEDESLFIDNGGQMNFLIEGDNLASLKLLEKTHKGKIDLIYIDPPYNTGNKSWKYNNDYVEKEDLFKHSKFSSFIYQRLVKAKTLLSAKGIIAVAIDDYEIQTVRLLLDEVFGEDSRLGTCVVIHNPGGRQDDKFFATTHEYMLIYAKNSLVANVGYLPITDEKKSQFTENDKWGAYKLRSLIRTGAHSRPHERPGLYYPIYVNPTNYDISTIQSNEYSIEVLPLDSSNEKRVWRWSKQTLMEKKDKYILCRKNKNNEYFIYVKERECDNKGYKPKTLWFNPSYSSASAIGQVKQIFNTASSSIFEYPKSIYLMVDIVRILCNKNSTILDFFAGSGTTGHAVMELNAEDGGQRKFILCTNNENNICRDVTYERIKRVIDKENYSASLKYFKVDFVPISDKLYYEYADELLKHVKELVELENAINFNGNDKIAIILTEEELDGFANAIPETCETVYLGHDVLPSEEQEKIFKKNGITVNVIPDYYYRDLEA